MNTPSPVRASELLQHVFERDERLVDIIAAHAPHLAKLRHSPMRRIMAKVTTVSQAARLCGIPADALVRELNEALGIEAPLDSRDAAVVDVPGVSLEASAAGAGPSARPAFARGVAVELDVRDDLRSGREPFSRIMAAIARLESTEVLLLRTTFEPVPLLAVLAKRGFMHYSEQYAPEDWSVWFHRSSSTEASGHGAEDLTPAEAPMETIGSELTEVRLDVRGLEPPEPMVRTLEALEVLPAECALLHVNVRVPQLLLPILRERGFDFEIEEPTPGEVHVRIWRRASEIDAHMLANSARVTR